MMRVSISIGADVDITVSVKDAYSPDVLEDLVTRAVIGASASYKLTLDVEATP